MAELVAALVAVHGSSLLVNVYGLLDPSV